MRQIILDTETTGLSPSQGHRVIEIGCLEVINRRLTGKHWHYYLNPERDIDPGAERVHGISRKFLKDKPLFKNLFKEFLDFLEDSELIIHNAPFDIGFLNSELALVQAPITDITSICSVIDTLALAREKHPGQKNNLDALCKRYNINNEHRTLHGALMDAEILAEVYFIMTGGQNNLAFSRENTQSGAEKKLAEKALGANEDILVLMATPEEAHAHELFMEKLNGKN